MSKADGLRWKLARLRTMTPREVAWRVQQGAVNLLQRFGLGIVRRIPPPEAAPHVRWLPGAPGALLCADAVTASAGKIMEGRFSVFALKEQPLGFPPDWLRDPKTGRVAPLSFGKTLNYRDERIVGDIKYLWEPSRHLEIVTLAQAWVLTQESRYAQAAAELLESWIAQNPYPKGPHWTSSLEHAVRLVNWSAAWQLLENALAVAGEGGSALRSRWLEAVYLHQQLIVGHLSRHSSANNHLLGEYMGLYLSALTWPHWPESRRWRDLGRAGMLREALLQNTDDGVNREQAIWYHHEVADMMLLCGLAARAAGEDFPAAYWQRLEAMLEFIASLMNVAGRLPMIGDADDAVMVRLAPAADFCPYRSLLATGALLFGRVDFARKAGALDDKSRWLLGPDAADSFRSLLGAPGVTRPFRRDFPEGGYWALGTRLDAPDEIRVVADAGPLGYLSIAAHGHADALSFTLSAAGRELLIDPGTFAYHTQGKWRDYFRGTSAHNTARVDGLNQSVGGGAFMWLRHAKCTVIAVLRESDRDCLVASHDGYARLPDPLRHEREVVLDKSLQRLTVIDRFQARGSHTIELFWHFCEDCVVSLRGTDVHAQNGSAGLTMRVQPPEGWRVRLVRGHDEPPLGWVSRRFDEKVPTSCVVWTGSAIGDTVVVTQFQVALGASDRAS